MSAYSLSRDHFAKLAAILPDIPEHCITLHALRTGQSAVITLDSYPSRQFKARLAHVSPIATTSVLSNRVRTFVAVFTIEESDPHLLPDLAAAVEIQPPAP